jgi:hypothetical protein
MIIPLIIFNVKETWDKGIPYPLSCLNLINGLGPTLDTRLKCTHFLYADDMIFFLQVDLSNIEAMMCALLAFEALSAIKINYTKN